MAILKKWAIRIFGVLALFCVGFLLFYGYFYEKAKAKQPTLSPLVLNKTIPESRLVDLSGTVLESAELQRGKVILVFVTAECESCLEESQYLSTVVNTRNDIRFYGVMPFGADKSVLQSAGHKFPFKVFFDEGFLLGRGLNIRDVPTKVYVEDGITKKTWVGSTIYYHKERDFSEWLKSLR